MKSLQWQQYLQREYEASHKALFSVSELANVAGRDAHALNVQLTRLVKSGVLVRYAQGRYALPGIVSVEDLLPQIDSCAYITGHWALFNANHIDQRPTTISCFTSRRHNRSRTRLTPLGRFVFTTVKPPVYSPPQGRLVAIPERALFDYVYLCLRNGLVPETLVRFRNLARLEQAALDDHARDYPGTVQRHVRTLLT